MFNRETRIWTVATGDTLDKIALSVYSDSTKSNVILNANKLLIDNPKRLINGVQLTVPKINHDKSTTKVGANDRNYLLTIDNQNIEFIDALKFRTGQSEGARTMAFAVPFEFASFAKIGSTVELYVNNVLFLEGYLITPDITYQKSGGHVMTWQCTTKVYPILHSHYKTSKSNPASWSNISLKSLFNKILSPFNLNAVINDETIGNEKYDKIGFKDDETIFSFLKRVANQKGFSLLGLANGDLLLYKAKKTRQIVGKFNDASRMAASYNYEGLGNEYRATNQKKGSGKSATATNTLIPFNIFKTIKQDSSNNGDLQKFINYQQSRIFAESLQLNINSESIFNDNVALYSPGDLISINAPELDIIEDTTFTVDVAEVDIDKSGEIVNLNCVLPELRAGEMPERLPFL